MTLRQLQLPLLWRLLLAATLAMAFPASAHHSFAAFERSKTVTLTGTVKTFNWANPHVIFGVLVPAGSGAPQEWSIETSSPAILKRFGWTRNSLKPGDHVSVVCNPLSDGSHGGRLHTVMMLDTGQILNTKLSASAPPEPN